MRLTGAPSRIRSRSRSSLTTIGRIARLRRAIAVRVGEITEALRGVDVQAEILVNRPSQKGIVIGKKGRLLKRVREQAERELAEMYGHAVVLRLWVKIEKDWAKNFWILKELGYA